MAEQRISFVRWMLRVEHGLRAACGAELSEAMTAASTAKLFELWERGTAPEKVVNLIASKITAAA